MDPVELDAEAFARFVEKSLKSDFADPIVEESTKPWKSEAIIAFVDLLGFSANLRETWDREEGALQALLNIKKEIQDDVMPLISMTGATYDRRAEVSLFSDSIIIVCKTDPALGGIDLFTAYAAVLFKVHFSIGIAARLGFGVRGAVELGELYWNGSEPIGPAFLDVYALEGVAKTARVIVGPTLLRKIGSSIDPASRCHRDLAEMLYLSADGCFSHRPDALSLEPLTKLQQAAPSSQAYRYDEIVQAAEQGIPFNPKPMIQADYEAAALAVEEIARRHSAR